MLKLIQPSKEVDASATKKPGRNCSNPLCRAFASASGRYRADSEGDEVPVYRGNERRAIVSFESPARGRLSAHAIRLIGNCCAKRGLNSRHPQALRALQGNLAGYILFEPVEVLDPNVMDQYEINWYRGNRTAYVDLLPILQPRNLEVPKGFVSEMPTSLEELPSAGWFLLLHTGSANVRSEKDMTADEEAQFTATDEDLIGDANVAAGQQKD